MELLREVMTEFHQEFRAIFLGHLNIVLMITSLLIFISPLVLYIKYKRDD